MVAELCRVAPEAETTVAEHRDDHDEERMLHLLFADLLRLTVASFEGGDHDLTARLLGMMTRERRRGLVR